MPPLSRPTKRYPTRNGVSQLTLVEHSLCPLDARATLRENFAHKCEYRYVDPEHGASIAHAKISSAEGLSANDEMYLWGLLGLTFAQTTPSYDFHATPHYCLRQLGLIETDSKGGKSYRLFRESVRRLSAVRYQNDRFYDPIRREHRQVSFGFFGYSLPIDPESSRAWRIVWDPQFFEICQAAGSQLGFDFDAYRELDPAARRLYLLLKKVFWRRSTSPWFDIRHLAVDVLGFSADGDTRKLKEKIKRVTEVLARHQMIGGGAGDGGAMFVKRGKGSHAVQFHRGTHFEQVVKPRRVVTVSDSPVYDPLRAIGFDAPSIRLIVSRFPQASVQLWADVTLAAMERKGASFFRRSPQAFFMDNVQESAAGRRTAPDWFLALRKEEEREQAERDRRARALTEGPSEKTKKGGGLERAIASTIEVEKLVGDMLGSSGHRSKTPAATRTASTLHRK